MDYYPRHHSLDTQRSNPYPPNIPLQVSTTDTSHDLDPNERTARPGNAHHHAQFHAHTLQPSYAAMDEDPPPESTSTRDSIFTNSTPGLSNGLTRPLMPQEQERLAHLDRLKFFLHTAPSRWDSGDSNDAAYQQQPSSSNLMDQHLPHAGLGNSHPALNRFLLPSQEYVSCVLWNGLYHITGTDIVRALVFRFEAFGRPVRNMKKFEEGVFSDLRNLKPGVDACLEEPKSPFLDLLFKYQCIRTQKKQKVFYWFSVPHDRLFLDALERDLKRENAGQEPTTQITGEPALSFTYDPKRSLYDQFSQAQGTREGEDELEAAIRRATEEGADSGIGMDVTPEESDVSDADDEDKYGRKRKIPPAVRTTITFGMGTSWLEGNPGYKQRKKKLVKREEERGRSVGLGMGSGRYASPSLSVSRERPEEFGAGREAFPGGRFVGDGDVQRGYFHDSGDVQTQAQRFLAARGGHGHHRTRSHELVQHRHTYPSPLPQATASSAGYDVTTFPEDAGAVGVDLNGTKTKAFICPLYSCGRMFKRMEHLKRHLRTHTMERPYICSKCQKRFSRSDNLNQHMRTHVREQQGGGVGEWIDASGDDAEGSGSVSGGSVRGDESDFDEEYFGGPWRAGGVPSSMGTGAAGTPFVAGDFDAQMCEVEVQGEVRDVSGDEEGLIMRATPGFVSEGGNGYFHAPPTYPDGNDPRSWTGTGVHASPAFSTISAPSPPPLQPLLPPPSSTHHIRSRSSQLMTSPGYRTHSSSSSVSTGYGGAEEFVSMSAPSHKLAFDHPALYPPPSTATTSATNDTGSSGAGGVDSMPGGPGPIRRHRSMTPNMMRGSEAGVRRSQHGTPDYDGSPRSSSGLGLVGARGYHPYANPGAGPAAGAYGSTHSSPSAFSMVPLGGGGAADGYGAAAAATGGLRRPDSRGSLGMAGVNEQMRGLGVAGVYSRTQSPFGAQTDSPAVYSTELPPVQQGYGHGHSQQPREGGGGYVGMGGYVEGMGGEGYFQTQVQAHHHQHATTI